MVVPEVWNILNPSSRTQERGNCWNSTHLNFKPPLQRNNRAGHRSHLPKGRPPTPSVSDAIALRASAGHRELRWCRTEGSSS